MEYARDYTIKIIKKVWPYVIVSVGLGAWIHGYVPADFLAQYAGAGKWYAIPFIIFASVVGLGIIFTGYLFNFLIG